MFLQRHLKPKIDAALKHFPVVLITGPRQSGKTELLKNSYSGYKYFSIDALDVKERAIQDPRSFLLNEDENIIFDEIQEVPELLNYIKEAVDKNRQPGRFILTGSQQFSLMKGVSESLAGRIAIFNLLPFSYSEIQKKEDVQLEDLLIQGFYPQIRIQENLNHELWFSSYIKTYLERDLRQQVQIKDMRNFEQFLRLLASRASQELNLNRIASEIGVHSQTLKSWLSALEAAFIIFLLPAYFENFGKRIIKSPKVYFTDVGLLSYLIKEKDPEKLLTSPMAGPLFENFVVSEFVKLYAHQGQQSPIYYWRSHGGIEVDLLIDKGHTIQPIEIKLTSTLRNQHVKNLEKFAKISKKELVNPCIVSRNEQIESINDVTAVHWREINQDHSHIKSC